MTLQVTHKFVSSIPDASDANLVRPSNWNDTHKLVATGPSVLGVATSLIDADVGEITWNPATFGGLASGLLVGTTAGNLVWTAIITSIASLTALSSLSVNQQSSNAATPLQITRSFDAASVDWANIFWDNPGTTEIGNRLRTIFRGKTTDGTTQQYGAFELRYNAVTDATIDSSWFFKIRSNVSTHEWELGSANIGIVPPAAGLAGTYPLGSVARPFGGLFLGGANTQILWNNDVAWTYTTDTITQTGGGLTVQASGVLPLQAIRLDDAATNEAFRVRSARATPTNNDGVAVDWYLNNGGGTLFQFARLRVRGTVIAAGSETSQWMFSTRNAGGALTDTLAINPGSVAPATASLITLGTSNTPFGQGFISATASPLTVTNTTDGATLQAANFRSARPTGAVNDEIYLAFFLNNVTPTAIEYSRYRILATNVGAGTEAGQARWSFMNAGALTGAALMTAVQFSPITTGAMSLGSTSNPWGNVFQADDTKLDWGNGGVTASHISASDSITWVLDSANALASTAMVWQLDGASRLTLTSTTMRPTTDGGLDLGNSATPAGWGNCFFATAKFLDWANNNVRITHSTALLTITGGGLVLAAGTTTLGPLRFTSGTSLTTAATGTFEYDGISFYATSVASARQVVVTEQVSVSSADQALADVATAQNWFTGAQDTFTVAATTTYEFEGFLWLTRAAGVTSHTTSVLFGGTATYTSIMYMAQIANPTGTVLGNPQQLAINVATATVLTAANTAATENIYLYVRGTMRINAGGTVIPQFQYSVAPGGAPTSKANTFFRIWPVGTNTVTVVGNIA